jgi:EAL domain-containing protein (putative c-di-GMP-specific phosphodiesterase class I)
VIAEVASDIGIETVAEALEEASTLCRLRELPIDFAQGFHLAHPIPLADVRAQGCC